MEINFKKATEILYYDKDDDFYDLAEYKVPTIRTDELLDKYKSKTEILKEIKKPLLRTKKKDL